MNKYYSNEIVFRGHPDKVCDQISGALLKEFVSIDKNTRAGIEVVGGKGKLFITGEVTSNAVIDVESVAKRVLRDVGYSDDMEIINNIGIQSADISQGVDSGGAGDNGMMFGYACNDTFKYLPMAMVILQEFSKAYDELRKVDKRFLADGKAQITGFYEDNKLELIRTFTICYQNTEKDRVATDKLIQNIALEICDDYCTPVTNFLINPTGKFLIGGFEGDSGLTGRKIVVDTYHGFAKVGGGAFSGKDMTKVDVSGAYMARELAKNFVKYKGLKWCEVQFSYSIGVNTPMAIYVDSNEGEIEVDFSLYNECIPKNIIKKLDLLNLDYEELAKWGHFTD